MKKSFSQDAVDDINHELKSPLATIKLCTDILRNQTKQLDKSSSHLEKINIKVDYLTQLINDYTDLIKIQNRYLSFKDEPISLEQILTKLSSVNQSVNINNNVPENPVLKIDFYRFNQVIKALSYYLYKHLPSDACLDLFVNITPATLVIHLYGFKDQKNISKYLVPNFNPKLDLTWIISKDFKISTSLAAEFYQHYHGKFFHYYNPQAGIIFEGILPLNNK